MELTPRTFDDLLMDNPHQAYVALDREREAQQRRLDHVEYIPASGPLWNRVAGLADRIGDSLYEIDLDYFKQTGETDAPYPWVRKHHPKTAGLLQAKRLWTQLAIHADRRRHGRG